MNNIITIKNAKFYQETRKNHETNEEVQNYFFNTQPKLLVDTISRFKFNDVDGKIIKQISDIFKERIFSEDVEKMYRATGLPSSKRNILGYILENAKNFNHPKGVGIFLNIFSKKTSTKLDEDDINELIVKATSKKTTDIEIDEIIDNIDFISSSFMDGNSILQYMINTNVEILDDNRDDIKNTSILKTRNRGYLPTIVYNGLKLRTNGKFNSKIIELADKDTDEVIKRFNLEKSEDALELSSMLSKVFTNKSSVDIVAELTFFLGKVMSGKNDVKKVKFTMNLKAIKLNTTFVDNIDVDYSENFETEF